MSAKRIYVAGHKGMVGRALVSELSKNSNIEIVTASRDQLDLTNQLAVKQFFKSHRVDEVYLAAAKVGGIHANNTLPASFIYENLMISANVINAAHESDINKLLFLGSSCIYPKFAEQPIKESSLLSGALEPTNEPYAIAKIAGIKLCESFNRQYGRDYRSVMPTNLYGPYDNFELNGSHVIPALINKFAQAKQNNASSVNIWGSGRARREFLHVSDLARGSIQIANLPNAEFDAAIPPMSSHINIGTGTDCSIRELAELLCEVTEFKGRLDFDTSKPEGTPVKRLDVSLAQSLINWKPSISLRDGLSSTWEWFQENSNNCRV